jgi:hypothetical protein
MPTWYVIHLPVGQPEKIERYDDEDRAKDAACWRLTTGQNVTELGTIEGDERYRKLDAQGIRQMCAERPGWERS